MASRRWPGGSQVWMRRTWPQESAVLAVAGGQLHSRVFNRRSRIRSVGHVGPVSSAALDQVEDFYQSRGAAATLDVCPPADPSFYELLGQRGYRITKFNNVLVLRLQPCRGSDVSLMERHGLRRARPEDENEWAFSFIWLAESAGWHSSTGVLFHLATDTFRRRGLHSALIRARLAYASAQGCEIATASTLPGSGSQRNYERLGFRVIYTKHIMSRV